MKNNYKAILKRLENIKFTKGSITPLIIIAEKLENGSYRIIETFGDYKRKEFIIENEEKFNDFMGKIDQEKCTIIIDDILSNITQQLGMKAILNCTDEELYTILNEEEGQEKEIGQILKRNLEELTDKKGSILE